MAKWKLETGQIIDTTVTGELADTKWENKHYVLIINFIKKIFPNLSYYAPIQQVGKESDFTILLDDGKTIRATLIKEPKDLMEHWEQNKVEGFILDTRGRELYFLANLNCEVLACIPKSWYLDRQIDALNKLIEIYKD